MEDKLILLYLLINGNLGSRKVVCHQRRRRFTQLITRVENKLPPSISL